MSESRWGWAPRIANLPEVNVFLFAFLLNLPWEFWQVPFYVGMPTAPHWPAIKVCTEATLGDAAIALFAFWVVAAASRSRGWVARPTGRQLAGFLAVGVAVTVLFEWLATAILDRWTYAPSMPTLPILGTGLVPLLQWMVLPPLIVWLVRRQLT